MKPSSPAPAESTTFTMKEVKYSLPGLLREIQQERAVSHFAQERLDQQEISKLFKNKPTRRAKSQK